MNPSPSYLPLSRRATASAFAAAGLVTAAVVSSILMLAHSAGSTPWLPIEQAALVAHCDLQRATTQRKACMQAALATRGATRLAAR